MAADDVRAMWVRVEVASTPDYEVWRGGSWYHSVDWVEASRIALSLVTLGGSDHPPTPDGLDRLVEQGVSSLLVDPIEVGQDIISNGGHRLAAMKRQGVVQTLGAWHQ